MRTDEWQDFMRFIDGRPPRIKTAAQKLREMSNSFTPEQQAEMDRLFKAVFGWSRKNNGKKR